MASKYQKLTQREHVLQVPDTYIGSIETAETLGWVVDATGSKFEEKRLQLNPGLFKMFDELIVNAHDHAVRMKQRGGTPVKSIAVTVTDSTITVRNDGDGIDVLEHPEHACYIPELIFGHLLTSTNYDKSEQKTVGGKNGYGAKLCNIFGKVFTVETVDAKTGKKYVQTWSDNMTVVGKPTIASSKLKPYVQISWTPDLSRLGYAPGSAMPADMQQVFQKRVWDIAGTLGKEVKVSYNGAPVSIGSFEKYAKMYLPADATTVSETIGDGWDVVVADNPRSKFTHVSFVNGISTTSGGTHVNAVCGQIVKHLAAVLSKKRKGMEAVSETLVENGLALFLRATVINPSFNSQTKDKLTTRAKDFGTDVTLPEPYLKKLATKLLVVTRLLEDLDAKAERAAKKTDGRKTSTVRGIPKLEDAEHAGTKQSAKCTLVLTEGDSAKSMVISGLSQEQRKFFGVYPLRGKVVNVKTTANPHANKEVEELKKILGLETGKAYSDVSALRYGRLLVMTDQDYDGSHIRGLLINLFHGLWTDLLKVPGFLCYMATPIVKASKGAVTRSFYTLHEYEQWKQSERSPASWKIKYFKGLGTSVKAEAQEYFKTLNTVRFTWSTTSSAALDLAFSKEKVDDRKDWLLKYDPTAVLTKISGDLPYDEFVHRDLKHFSAYDLQRSIPNVMDGLKVSQRKIVFAAFKRNLKDEVKVAQFAGYVSEHTGYHHGEDSLNGAIIGMAQDFVGSNNINLFVPNGQFGTRLEGNDHAAPRYIYTHLAPEARALFPSKDFPVLDYMDDDGTPVEPRWYAPVLPLLLINGAEGIGTGFSTTVPPFNPKDIATYVRGRMDGSISADAPWAPKPFYRGWTGKVESTADSNLFLASGTYCWQADGSLRITELPPGVWTNDFKEDLTKLQLAGTIVDFVGRSTDMTVDFTVTLPAKLTDAQVAKTFKLVKNIRLNNMHAFDALGKIQRYDSAKAVVDAYLPVRLDLLAKRKAHRLAELDAAIVKHDAIVKFLTLQLEGKLDLRNRARADVETELDAKHRLAKQDNSYAYLLRMPMSSVTKEEVQKHREDLAELRAEHAELKAKTTNALWLEDLAAVEKTL